MGPGQDAGLLRSGNIIVNILVVHTLMTVKTYYFNRVIERNMWGWWTENTLFIWLSLHLVVL